VSFIAVFDALVCLHSVISERPRPAVGRSTGQPWMTDAPRSAPRGDRGHQARHHRAGDVAAVPRVSKRGPNRVSFAYAAPERALA